jgi:hypothetical protein
MSFTRIDANNISPSGVAAGTYTNPTITINSSGQVTDASSGQLAQGIQGLQGIIGPQGVQGLGGIQGSSGYIGSDGIQGIQGIQGAGAGLAVAEYTTYVYTGDGTTTTFAATSGLTVHTILVVVDGVTQTPTTNYTISGSNIVLASAPPSGSVVQLRVLGGLIGPQGISGGSGSSVTISSIEVTDSSYSVLDDTAVSVNGGYIKITGTGFVSGCQVVIGSAVASSVTYVSSTVVHCQVPAQTAGTYTVYLTNPNGSVAIRVNGINYSSTPTWTTTSPLPGGVKNTAISIQLAATSNSAITYSLASGSTLPSGLTLSTSGLLSGTVTTITADTAYNFTIVATDQENQDTPQAFQITIIIGDPYYEYVTLHLPGTGTNLATNNTFLDSSINNFTITRSGNTTQGTFSPFSQTGWGNYFDGSGDYLALSSPAVPASTSDFTLEGWFNVSNYSATRNIFTQNQTGASSDGRIIVNITTAGILNATIGGTNLPGTLNTTTTITTNVWHHFALVRSSNTFTLYLNGVSEVTGSGTGTIANQNSYIGSNLTQSVYFLGSLSNIRVVASAVYTSNFTPPTAPLTAISGTSLLTCQSNRFIDNSSNNFAITVNGNTSVQAFSPFNPTASWSAATYGGSGYFDGSGDYLTAPNNAAFAALPGDFTLELWVYLTAQTTGNALFGPWAGSAGSAANSSWLFTQGTTSASNLRFVYSNGSSVVIYEGSGGLGTNQWFHLVAVRSGTNFALFSNGNRVYSNASVSASIPQNTSNLGVMAGADGAFASTGYVSSARVVKGTAVYDPTLTTLTVPTAPLTAITNTSLLLNFTNAGIYDATSKNDLETVGNAQISTTQYKFPPSSMAFDGTGDSCDITLSSPFVSDWSANFTIELWAYTNNLSAQQILFANIGTNSSGYNSAYIYANGSIGIGRAGINDLSSASSTWTSGQWNHLAFVRNGVNLNIYYNGSSVASTSSASTYLNSTVVGLAIGKNFQTTPAYFNGYMQDLRITKGYARYTSNFTPPTQAFQTL